jgi:Mor family transcriptional regulator
LNENLEVITEEDLPEEYSMLLEEIGFENTIKVAKLFGGCRIYYHKYDTIEKPLRNRRIMEEFNGYNYLELARKYNLTENTIRKICSTIVVKKRSRPMDGQLSLL